LKCTRFEKRDLKCVFANVPRQRDEGILA